MTKIFLRTILLAFFPYLLFSQNDLKIGDWRTYLPYRTGLSVTQSDNNVYWATGLSVLEMNKTDLNIEKIDKLNTLTDVGVRLVRYNKDAKTLFVVYENNNIDLIRTEGSAKNLNLPDIKNNSSILGDKTIYDVHFVNDTAYLACGFGISKLDVRKGEFIYTTFTKLKTYSIVVFEGKIWAATEGGIYTVPNDNRLNLADFKVWTKLDATVGFPNSYTTKVLAVYDNKLYFDLNDSLAVLQNNTPLSIRHESGFSIQFMTAEGQNLVIGFWNKDAAGNGKTLIFNKNNTFKTAGGSCVSRPLGAVEDATGRLYFADLFNGFRFLTKATDTNCSVVEYDSPYAKEVSDIAVTDTSAWVAFGGLSGINPRNNGEGFASFTGGKWQNFNGFGPQILNDSIINRDFHNVEINKKTGKIYAGSVQNGLVELVGNKVNKIYNASNSAIQAASADPFRRRVTGLAFDQSGNLWVSNNLSDNPVVVLKADGKWAKLGNVPATNIFQVIVDGSGTKWFIISGSQTGLLLYNENKAIDDVSDDKITVLDNSNLPKELQSARINYITTDLNGEVWVGTSGGVCVFRCGSDPFKSTCNASLIVNSLGNINEYLLREKNVNTIAIDGANRKWFGTSSGLFVTSADGKEEVFKFNTENSPLLSNNITALAIRPNGEVFIGTDKGLMSFKSEATEGGDYNDQTKVLAYPNPVRPDYEGPIAIKGFARDANVKIADVNGNVVFETKALGGQAIWNGRDFNGNRVSTGVYLVLATNTKNLDAPDAVVTKILFMN
ncbi:MAG: hypothetical protein JNL70_16700 [Saprospiraceae bacterium]|nr:hypothetical protein [Saprospiraceae bacterium]